MVDFQSERGVLVTEREEIQPGEAVEILDRTQWRNGVFRVVRRGDMEVPVVVLDNSDLVIYLVVHNRVRRWRRFRSRPPE